MTEDRDTSRQIQTRIAEALGIDTETFSATRGSRRSIQETVELLTAFARIAGAEDRRACIAFIQSLADREQPLQDNAP